MILHDEIQTLEKHGVIKADVPKGVKANLAPAIALRPYQERAISRFVWKMDQERDGPAHLLFHMATGSGKTVIMAATMLHLYEQGYRDFLFFVNASQIVEKTKANFIDALSSKYLFAPVVLINEKTVPIRAVTNFSDSQPDAINIVFTTIQGLHTVLNNPKEDGVTFEDFADRRVVMISDEAHHINALTKSKLSKTEGEEASSWEYTVRKILNHNAGNILLEFSATVDMAHDAIAAKYADKLIMDYPLRAFRRDRYSKDIELRQVDQPADTRMLEAIIISEYRRAIARDVLGQDWKPVVLMKSETIAKSEGNEAAFRTAVDELDAAKLAQVRETAQGVLAKAFAHLAPDRALENLALTLRAEFGEARCTNMNNAKDVGAQQILLNSLEDAGNPIRCIFAVNKLDEGWDVLNLFDIVRLDERSGTGKKPAETTMREAQLIGRGARYYPFVDPQQLEYPANLRKYDSDHTAPMRLLEQVHYHCTADVKYISDIKKALVITGALEEGEKTVELRVKDAFKQTDIYKGYSFFANKRVRVDKTTRKGNDVLTKRGFVVDLQASYSGAAVEVAAFDEGNITTVPKAAVTTQDIRLNELGLPLLRRACDEINAFRLTDVRQAIPAVSTMAGLLLDPIHLGDLRITIRGPKDRLSPLQPSDALHVARAVLSAVAADLKRAKATYEGSQEFEAKPIASALKDRTLKLNQPGETQRSWAQSLVESTKSVALSNEDWHVFDDCYGTSEEKEFLVFVSEFKEQIRANFDEFYVVRNEKAIKLVEFGGDRGVEPDYILIMRRKDQAAALCRQVFIEPKGKHLENDEVWKSTFLTSIAYDVENAGTLAPEAHEIRGLPFFNAEPGRRQGFQDAFESMLK
jgi:type III restriction enzyme